MSKKVWSHIALFTVNLLYGANYVVAKGVMPKYVGPNGFIFMRVIGAVFLFWMVLLFKLQKVAKRDLATLALCGLFGVGINQLLFFNGLMRTSPLNASLIMTATPIIVFVLSMIIIKEKANLTKIVGICLGAVGSVSLILLSGKSTTESSALGDLFIILNAVSYSIYLVLVKPLMSKYNPLTVITWVFTFGMIYILIWPFSISEFIVIDWNLMPIDIPWRILFVVIGVTFLPYLLTVIAMKNVSPSIASSYIYFQPMIASGFIYLSFLLGMEDYTADFSIYKIGSALFIFVGVYLVSKK